MKNYYIALKKLSQRFPPAILAHEGELFDASHLSPSKRNLLVGIKAMRLATKEEVESMRPSPNPVGQDQPIQE